MTNIPPNIRDIIEGRRPDLSPAVVARYAAQWGNKAAIAPTRRELPCVHEGGVKRPCGSTTGERAEARHVRECDLFGECARGEPVVAHVCTECDRYDADPALKPPPPAPLSLVEVGPEGLSRARSGYAFNAGLTRYRGTLLLAYRDGWSGSNVHVAELNEDYTVRRSVVLAELAGHPACNVGREDPRLFTFRGRLHVAFIGVERIGGGAIRTNQMYARLTDDLAVEEVFFPEYQYRQGWEKNWQFFEYSGELFCVYMVAPHVILHVIGNKAYPFTETVPAFPWSGGLLRGGAPPVLVGDRWYHWFHGRGRHPETGEDTYNVGVYTFEAHPPFRILSMTPEPILWGNKAENAADANPNYIVVAFPQGAILERGRWVVSMGWNDRRIKVAEWAFEEVNRAMGL